MEQKDTFANRLKYIRDSKKLTLEQLSNLTGVPAQTLSRYELGQRVPKIDVAVSIAIALGVDPLWLQGYEEAGHESAVFYLRDGSSREEPALSETEERMRLLARHLEQIPPEQRQRLIKNFEETIDIYFEATGRTNQK